MLYAIANAGSREKLRGSTAWQNADSAHAHLEKLLQMQPKRWAAFRVVALNADWDRDALAPSDFQKKPSWRSLLRDADVIITPPA